jgi:release factor glutamine methyltransferase
MKNQERAWLLKEKYQGVESEAFHADCAQLAAGVPLGYLIGHVPFLDCTIHLDSHPLIPRPETEYWVDMAIAAIQQSNLPQPHILDICAGSGAIGVALAKAIPKASVTFAEIDPSHLPTIEKNIKLNVPADSVTEIIQSDLFSAITHSSKFDFIVTNPPYIDAAANTVDTNVVENEPHLALFGGALGMEIIVRIIADAPRHLNSGGQLWIEHEPAQVEAIMTVAIQNGFSVVTHPDQYGIPRFSVLTMAQ